MVIPRSLTFLTAFHGGWDFGCCRIGLAASAMDFESGLPPECKGKASLHRKAKIPFPAGKEVGGIGGRKANKRQGWQAAKQESPPLGSCTAGSARAASGSGAGMQGAEPLA